MSVAYRALYGVGFTPWEQISHAAGCHKADLGAV